jgi:hypothetical protein
MSGCPKYYFLCVTNEYDFQKVNKDFSCKPVFVSAKFLQTPSHTSGPGWRDLFSQFFPVLMSSEEVYFKIILLY